MTAIYSAERPDDLSRFDLTIEDEFDVIGGHQHNGEFFEALLRDLETPGHWLPKAASEHIEWSQFNQEAGGARPVEFGNHWEREFARALDAHRVPWLYKPRTFAVEWDEEGNFVDSFTPDFYLPVGDLYIALAAPEHESHSTRARKVRLLRQQYLSVDIELISEANFRNIVDKLRRSRGASVTELFPTPFDGGRDDDPSVTEVED